METHEDALPAPRLPLLVAADLQGHLIAVGNDLDRLQTLLADACTTLLQSFHAAADEVRGLRARPAVAADSPQFLDAAIDRLGNAVVALQFEDMATQLIHHTHLRLRSCVDELARQTFADDEEGPAVVEAAPLRPNPVTQDEMDAGSVQLF